MEDSINQDNEVWYVYTTNENNSDTVFEVSSITTTIQQPKKEINMEKIYLNGMEYMFWAVGFLSILLLSLWAVKASIHFVTEPKEKKTPSFFKPIEKIMSKMDDIPFGIFWLLFILAGFILVLIWPLIPPVLMTVGLLYSLRGFFRLKKKVDLIKGE